MPSIYPWQHQAWQYLLNCKNSNKLPHAILIKGMEGLGKYHFARCFAEFLLCQKAEVEVCGTCHSCQLLQSTNNHPDLLIVQPEAQSKSIKIDQIRELVTELGTTSQQGGYKIVIINQAELLNISASNALLKTLEEPAPNAVIILVTSRSEVLAATIISRCQLVSMKAPLYAEVQEWLKQEASDSNQKLVFTLVENAPMKALKFMREHGMNKRIEFFQYVYALQNEKISIIQMAEKCLDWDLVSLLMLIMSIISDIIKIKFKVNESVINQDQIEELVLISIRISLSKLFIYYSQLVEIHRYLIAGINFNQQLIIEKLIITFEQLFVD